MADGEGKRRLKPRQRGHRSLREPGDGKGAPQTPFAAPEWDGVGWVVRPPLAPRLHHKSVLGKPVSGDSVRLTAPEVMFCHWHRHLPLPSEKWVSTMLEDDPLFMHESAILERLRDGGERVVMASALTSESIPLLVADTWAMRWRRDEKPASHKALAQVRWAPSHQQVDWEDLLRWARRVDQQGQKAEFLVIDGEFDVTSYRLRLIDPSGSLRRPEELSDSEWSSIEDLWGERRESEAGTYLRELEAWPLPSLGVLQMDGRWLGPVEAEWLQSRLTNAEFSSIQSLLDDLLSRGLLPRPGFKYGCRWRVYEAPMDEEHAPWLLSALDDAPTDWDGACLSARLASGVHKTWICAVREGEEWNYLTLERFIIGRD